MVKENRPIVQLWCCNIVVALYTISDEHGCEEISYHSFLIVYAEGSNATKVLHIILRMKCIMPYRDHDWKLLIKI